MDDQRRHVEGPEAVAAVAARVDRSQLPSCALWVERAVEITGGAGLHRVVVDVPLRRPDIRPGGRLDEGVPVGGRRCEQRLSR
ncbi:MAG: hypothetical protein WBV89_12645, partial [Ilumatobacter sp.]